MLILQDMKGVESALSKSLISLHFYLRDAVKDIICQESDRSVEAGA